MLPVEKQNVNTKAHPEGVDPVGRSNKEAMARRKRTATHKAHEPRQSRICDANPVSENRLAYRIGDAQQLPRSWTHGVWQLDFALATLNENQKDHNEEDSCDNANNCGCIHAFSCFKVDKTVKGLS